MERDSDQSSTEFGTWTADAVHSVTGGDRAKYVCPNAVCLESPPPSNLLMRQNQLS